MFTKIKTGLRRVRRLRHRIISATPKQLCDMWWYYSIELEPGRIAKGIYPEYLPMLPRIMLRRCQFAGLDCLDLGSMEGLIPILMKRQGARRVMATDFNDHCAAKMAAVRRIYQADFGFRPVGLLYDLSRSMPRSGYDLINLSGLLYHVFSPLLVLAAVRPLLKRNGLLIVSTNVVNSDTYSMEFNAQGRMQVEANTFWYPSISLFDYLLRFLGLSPIACEFFPHQAIATGSIAGGGEYVFDKPSGYLSVICRATDEVATSSNDAWMRNAVKGSWEHRHLIDWRRASRQPVSSIGYVDADDHSPQQDLGGINLFDTIKRREPYTKARNHQNSHLLRLEDQY